MNIIPYNKLKSGSHNVNLSYDGASLINKAYYGEALTLVRFSEYPRVKLDTESLFFPMVGGTQEVGVISNALWSASTSSSWLTITTAATGITVTATENDTGEDRSATITITAWNIDATITTSLTVSEPFTIVNYVSYIHDTQMSNASNRFIPLGFVPSHVTRGRITGKMKDYNTGSVLVGQSGANDSRDWRVFFTNRGNWYMDVGNSRTNGNIGTININDDIDVSFGNLYVENNKTEQKVSGTTNASEIDNIPISVCVGCIWVSSVQLWEGDTLIFDGVAAEVDGKYGLFDSVTYTLFTNNSINIVGEE